MRLLAILAILTFAGCAVNTADQSLDAPWVQPVEEKLSIIEEHYQKWKQSRTTTTVPSSKDYWGVQLRIWDLWTLTGHCLYADIPCNKLVENAPQVSRRYRDFVRKHAKTQINELLLQGLEKNIELIRTEYCLPALLMIQRKVSFENPTVVTDYQKCLKIPADDCANAHQAMQRWFEQNKNRLVWNPVFGVFNRDSAWNFGSFRLPDEATKAMHNIFGVSNLRPSPLQKPPRE